jgi:hypothetical protein
VKHELRLMPEWSAFPLWTEGRMVSPETLPISETLRRDLQAWNDDYTDTGGVAPDVFERPASWDPEPFRQRGWELAERLADELGSDVEVTVELWEE